VTGAVVAGQAATSVLAAGFSRTSTGEEVAFWLLAVLAVAAALGVVTAHHAVHAALLLVVDLFCLAVFYALEDALFLAAVQVIVYAGAIMILFLFVLMLVGVDASDSLVETLRGQRLAAAVFGLATLGLLIGLIGNAETHARSAGLTNTGNVQGIARLLFTTYLLPFEATSALLITAALGAMVLGHRERLVPRPTQRDLVERRFSGSHPSPLPGPGVYALHDAVDSPGLLPDGSPDPGSLPAVRTEGGT
jgi:NADH-quinone oxidoreductase subunit J